MEARAGRRPATVGRGGKRVSGAAHPSDGPHARPSWQEAADLLYLADLIVRRVAGAGAPPVPGDPPSSPAPARVTPPAEEPDADLPPTGLAAPKEEPDPDLDLGEVATRRPRGGYDEAEARSVSHATRRRALTQRLTPFKVTVASSYGDPELDEIATAERAALDDLWLPVFEEASERFLDLDVVIDDSRFSLLHRGEALRFVEALHDVGAFRRLRAHLLDTDQREEAGLRLRGTTPADLPVPAAALSRPSKTGRRLILVLTDGIGEAWHTRAAQRLLGRWGHHAAVGVVHLLPTRLWGRTGIGVVRTELRAPAAAVPNSLYGKPERARSVLVPVLELDAAQIGAWAGFVVADRPEWRGAAVPCDPDELPPAAQPVAPPEELSAEQRVGRFRTGSSPTAFKLAVHLAAAPLSPPVMQVVQQKLLPRSDAAHLVELLGSDLVRSAAREEDTLPIRGGVPFEFVTGVREALLLNSRRSDTARVLVTVAEHLCEEVDELRELRDVILSPGEAELPDISAELLPLFKPAMTAMEALAGPYRTHANHLKAALTGETAPHGPADGDRPPETGPPVSEPGNVYPHVAKDPPTIPDPLGVVVKMTETPVARKRQLHEPIPVWNVPQRNSNFTGREELLAMLHERLSAGTTAVVPEALHGLGGVGKSQIAMEYAYRHQNDYDLIWWISSERLTMVRQAFVDLAVHLDLNVTEPNVAVPAVREALRLGRPYADWLLVFDNAEDVEEIRRFFPTNGPGKIMITSRSRDWFAHAAPLEVDVFTRQESRDLLRQRGPGLSDQDANELSDRLGDLPLAIEQAAVWLSETGMPISEYLQLFDAKRDELLHVEGAEVPVAAAWNVSFDRLRDSHPAALQLLQVCAFFAPEPIPRSLLTISENFDGPPELVAALSDPIELSRTLRAVSQYGLAKLNHRDGTISLHRLVQRVVASQLPPDEAANFQRFGHMLLANANPRDPRNRVRWKEYHGLFPHVFSAEIERSDVAWVRQLFLDMTDFLFYWGDFDGFRALADRGFDTWSAVEGSEHDMALAAELRLGRALRLFGDFEAAHRHHLHARDAFARRLGEDHERTLEAQGYLGADLRYLGRFNEALVGDQRAYETLSRRFGPEDPLTLEQAHLLAIDLRLTGDPVAARQLDEQTLERKRDVFGPEHLSTISSRAALNIDVMECGDYLDAREMQHAHTEVMRRRFQNSHPATMDAIALLSVMSRKAGDHERALELSQEALSLFKARYGEIYQGTVAITLNHSVNLRHTGDLRESVEIGEQAKEQYAQIFGPAHPNTPTADVNVAVSLRLMGRLQEAYDLDRRAHEVFLEALGEHHPRTLLCAVNLASDLVELGEIERALELDRETLRQLRRVQGHDHPTTLACALNLSLDMRAMGQDAEAAPLLADTLKRYQIVLGKEHPALLGAAQGKRANCDIYPISL